MNFAEYPAMQYRKLDDRGKKYHYHETVYHKTIDIFIYGSQMVFFLKFCVLSNKVKQEPEEKLLKQSNLEDIHILQKFLWLSVCT